MDMAAGHEVRAQRGRRMRQPESPPDGSEESQPAPDALMDVDASRGSEPRRSQSLARATHELKSPLAVIKCSATTLLSNRGQWDAATQQELLQLIDTQADRLTDLVNGLLDVWRLRAEMLPLRIAPMDIDTLLGDLAATWRTRDPHHPLHVAVSAPLPETPLDVERMRHALEHIVACAAADVTHGTPIRIEARASSSALTLLVIRPGQTPLPDECARMFDLVAPSGEPREGLAVDSSLAEARAIVQAHGGYLIARPPARGSGLVFEISLPLVPAIESPAAQSSLTPTVSERRARKAHERPCVLLADDDPHMARHLRANLEAQGYRAIVATNPHQLVRLLDLEDPDLVLLDADLGDTTGTSVLEQLREYDAIPMIVLGRGDEAECVRALDMGARDYLARPFSVRELIARVRVALRDAARAAEGDEGEAVFHSGELTIDFAQRQVTIADTPVQLSRTEYKLLRVLAQDAGRVLSHDLLLERVWGPAYRHEVEFLWVYVRRLRRKIEPDPRTPRYILTISGVGYRLAQL